MTDILLIRHSTTDFVNNRLAGRIDSPLNELGRRRSQELAVALSTQPIKAVYASPLQRAIQTARPLADRLRLKVQSDERLLQVNYGDWEGKSFWELEQDPSWRKFIAQPGSVHIPGGESAEHVQKRGMSCLDEIGERYGDDDMVVAITHGSVIRFVIASYLGMDVNNANRLKIYPASVSVLRLGGVMPILVSLNRLFLE
ncbi:MAG: histidine phosphatase family protein [Anaerolineaceae bacterium]|nr:histidine phosphatase family protein [Anaerolineaceae bacterium]